MRTLLAALMTMAMLVPAYSQRGATQDTHPANRDPYQLQLERERREQAENERAYNATMKRLKDQAPTSTSNDPWKTVRPSDGSAPKR